MTMTNITNRQLIRLIRRAGPVYLPVECGDDIVHLAVEKSGLIKILQESDPQAQAAWCQIGDDTDFLWLDTNTYSGWYDK